MRTAAGILMIITGAFLLMFGAVLLSDYALHYGGDFALGVLLAILAIFSIIGGVFCLGKKYWKVCFASALLLFILSAIALSFLARFWAQPATDVLGALVSSPSYGFFLMVMGIPPLIFVCLRRREWAEPDFLRD